MKPNNVSVFEMFEREQRYIVPLFQRPYVWSLEKQWQPLWEDVAGKANEYQTWRGDGTNEPTKHFMGAIVLNPIRTFGLQVPAKLVIDGQQRLTTLQIMLIAMRDCSVAVKHTGLEHDLKRYTYNDCRKEQEIEIYKVWPTNADQPIFEDVFKAKTPAELEKKYPPIRRKYTGVIEPRHRLVEAYLYFFGAIQKYIMQEMPADASEGVERQWKCDHLDALEQAFKRYLEIVTIDLEEGDNPQIIFETLNARGEPLTPSDLIRNLVFLEASKQKLPIEKLYAEYWYPYDKPGEKNNTGFWKEQEKSGRAFRQRLDLFVSHYLTLRQGREIVMGKLYQEFTTWWKADPRQVDTELITMKRYTDAFYGFYRPEYNTRQGIFMRRLRIMDLTTLYPLLLFLLEERKDGITPAELNGIIVDLESFLVRRMVCDLPTKNYNNLFLSFLTDLKDSKEINRQTVQTLLLKSDAETSRWPNDADFERSWLAKPVYTMLHNRAKMVLEALDLQLVTNKQERLHLESPVSIEHVMPQAWQANYPLPQIDGQTEAQAAASRENLLHTFGNLTLVTEPLNSANSNKAFNEKRGLIAGQSALRLNVYFQHPRDKEAWTETDIVNRGSELLKTAKVIWPHP